MTKFIFLTSGAINYLFAGVGLYDSIVQTSLGKRFPALKKGQAEEIQERIKKLKLKRENLIVLSACSRQTRETAKIIGKFLEVPLKSDERLNSVLFDFEKIMNKDEFFRLGSKAFDIARPRFLKRFFEDQLLESKLSVKKRIDSFLNDYSINNVNVMVLAISHSFLMMIMKAYLFGGDEVFKNSELLRRFCRPEKRPFGFLSGFEVGFGKDSKSKMLKYQRIS